MDNLIKKLSAKTLAELQQLEKELEAKATKHKAFQADVNEIHDNFIFLETLKSWQEEGCNGDEPKRELFTGSWHRLISAKQADSRKELSEFEKQVTENARKINLY